MGKNLYSYKTYFKLTSGTKSVMIDEPVNWDKADITVPREPTYFGFIAEFISDDISLQWPESDKVAFEFIRDIYEENYGDGVIVFEFGILNGNVQVYQFAGNLNLNTYVKEYVNGQFIITCSVARLSFEDLFRTRFDTAIDFSKTVTLDNKPITLANYEDVLLHARGIKKEFKSFTGSPREASSEGQELARYLNVQLDVSDGQVAELDGGQGIPLSISGTDPRDDSLYAFGAVEAGDYSISFKANFHITIRRGNLIGNVGSYYLVPRLMIVRGGVTVDYIEFNEFRHSGSSDYFLVEFEYSCNIVDLKKTLQVGDQLYIGFSGTMGFGGTEYQYFITNYTSTTDILAETTAESTLVSFYRAIDVLNKMMEYVTGRANCVVSSILEAGGELNATFLTNGYRVRDFDVSEKPFISSLKAYFESILAFRGLGYSIENIGGLDYLVVEPMQYFYRDKLIKKLNSVYDYREEHAKDKTFNEYEVGYSKYPDSDPNTLDEYNTYQAGAFPIKTYKAKFTKKIPYITSGYALENQRREQFKENPSESLSNDDDIFMVCAIDGRIKYSTPFVAVSATQTLTTRKPLAKAVVGMSILCERSSAAEFNLDKSLTITSITPQPDGSVMYGLGDAVLDETGLGLFSLALNGIVAESNEMFNAVSGIFSPETAYNLRWTPRRILYNWMPYLNIGLSKKGDLELIQNTFMKNNSTLSSELDIADKFQENNSVGLYLEESKDLEMSQVRTDKIRPLHEPVYAYFKSDLRFSDFTLIRDRLTGKAQSGTDRGYVVHSDADGKLWKSFVYNLKYTPKTGVAEFQVAKYKIY